MTAEFIGTTGQLRWSFTALDPVTLDVPWDPLEGFLPPNQDGTEGQGFISYTVRSRADLATGDQITAKAKVKFDTNN